MSNWSQVFASDTTARMSSGPAKCTSLRRLPRDSLIVFDDHWKGAPAMSHSRYRFEHFDDGWPEPNSEPVRAATIVDALIADIREHFGEQIEPWFWLNLDWSLPWQRRLVGIEHAEKIVMDPLVKMDPGWQGVDGPSYGFSLRRGESAGFLASNWHTYASLLAIFSEPLDDLSLIRSYAARGNDHCNLQPLVEVGLYSTLECLHVQDYCGCLEVFAHDYSSERE